MSIIFYFEGSSFLWFSLYCFCCFFFPINTTLLYSLISYLKCKSFRKFLQKLLSSKKLSLKMRGKTINPYRIISKQALTSPKNTRSWESKITWFRWTWVKNWKKMETSFSNKKSIVKLFRIMKKLLLFSDIFSRLHTKIWKIKTCHIISMRATTCLPSWNKNTIFIYVLFI